MSKFIKILLIELITFIFCICGIYFFLPKQKLYTEEQTVYISSLSNEGFVVGVSIEGNNSILQYKDKKTGKLKEIDFQSLNIKYCEDKNKARIVYTKEIKKSLPLTLSSIKFKDSENIISTDIYLPSDYVMAPM